MTWALYFAKCVAANGADMGAIKIGCSYRMTHRLADISRNEPFDLELIASCAGDMFQESAVHMWFREHRIGGEFFRDHPDVIEFAQEAQRLGRIPLPISEAEGWWLTCDEVAAFLDRHKITHDDIAAVAGTRPASVGYALKKPQPNRRLVGAVCIAAIEKGAKVSWSHFRVRKPIARAA